MFKKIKFNLNKLLFILCFPVFFYSCAIKQSTLENSITTTRIINPNYHQYQFNGISNVGINNLGVIEFSISRLFLSPEFIIQKESNIETVKNSLPLYEIPNNFLEGKNNQKLVASDKYKFDLNNSKKTGNYHLIQFLKKKEEILIEVLFDDNSISKKKINLKKRNAINSEYADESENLFFVEQKEFDMPNKVIVDISDLIFYKKAKIKKINIVCETCMLTNKSTILQKKPYKISKNKNKLTLNLDDKVFNHHIYNDKSIYKSLNINENNIKKINLIKDFRILDKFNWVITREKANFKMNLFPWNSIIKETKKKFNTLNSSENPLISQILSANISKFLGNPLLYKIEYLTDLSVLHFQVISENYVNNCPKGNAKKYCDSKSRIFSFVSNEKITNEEANIIKNVLSSSKIDLVINFKINNGKIYPFDGIIFFEKRKNTDNQSDVLNSIPISYSNSLNPNNTLNLNLNFAKELKNKIDENIIFDHNKLIENLLSNSVNNQELKSKLKILKDHLKEKIKTIEEEKTLELEIKKIISKLKEIQTNEYEDDLNSKIEVLPYKKENKNIHAIVIGISRYPEMPPVIYADRSAKSFANFSIKKFGINPNNITMLLDNDATAKKIETKLLQITKRINKNDTLLFYYSGHSAPDFNGNNAFLIPSDTSPGFYKDPFFSVKNFYNFLSNINAKNVIVILDTCFAGKTDENTYIVGDIAPIMNMTSSLNVSPDKKITLLTSSKGDQISNSHRTKGHRLFTYYFLQEYLKKQTFNESTFKSIKEQVNSKSLKIGIANEQTPTIDGENFEKFFMLIE